MYEEKRVFPGVGPCLLIDNITHKQYLPSFYPLTIPFQANYGYSKELLCFIELQASSLEVDL